MDTYERIAKSVCDTEDTLKATLSVAIGLNIRNQMEYLNRMFFIQAISKDEYIDEMSSLGIVLEDLASDVFGYQKKEGEK